MVKTHTMNLVDEDDTFLRWNPPHIMNAKELAVYLGISERKIRSDTASGKIPSVRIGGRVVFRLSDIDQCLENLKRGKQ